MADYFADFGTTSNFGTSPTYDFGDLTNPDTSYLNSMSSWEPLSSSYTADDWAAWGTEDSEFTDSWLIRNFPELAKAGDTLFSKLSDAAKYLGTEGFNALKKTFTKKDSDEVDWGRVAAAAGGLYGLYQSQNQQAPEKTGYQGGIPKYEAVRESVQGTYDPSRRPGSGGQRYFSDMQFVAPEGSAAARTAAQEQATGLAALNLESPARESRSTPTDEAVNRAEESAAVQEGRPASEVISERPVPQYAQGGIAMLAKGGAPRYLNGPSDGMADKIPARIDNKQEARLSHGEFVIPADVVGHLGNGNSEAGAQRLYDMMSRIRKARTGTPKQGKQINPDKFMPG